MSTDQTILTVQNLTVVFRSPDAEAKAVDDVSFQLQRGQTLGIVGESGSGKSVTALAVMGLVPNPPGKISDGQILFTGTDSTEDLQALPEEQRRQYRGSRLSMIFQEPMTSLNPVFNCGFQLIEAIRFHEDISEAQARRQAMNLLQEVKLLPSDDELQQQCLEEWQQAHSSAIEAESSPASPSESELTKMVIERKQQMLQRYPHELSGGQLQRMMIAMAIACNPDILIADEPTTALDVTVQAQILNLLRELRDRRGMSMIFITHDLGLIADIADQVAVMYQGKIVESGTVLEIFESPQHPYTKGLLTCRPQPNRRLRYLPCVSDFMEVTQSEEGELQVQERQLSGDRQAELNDEISLGEVTDRLQELQKKEPLLTVKDLRVGFPVKGVFGAVQRYMMAVDGVSFEIYPGETLGLVGESGCGKTTLARTLMQLVRPLSGQIQFDGRSITQSSSKNLRSLRREMQIIFQDPFSSLDPRMSVGQAVMEPMRIHRSPRQGNQQRDRAVYLLERVGLSAAAIDRYPHEFSGGQRQRICIARALALNPKFIVCDESVSALDVSVQAQVLNLLKELQAEFGLTYIFISHDLSVVKFMSDRIMVMNRGKIEEIGTADDIYYNPQQDYTRQLIAAIPIGSIEQIRHRQANRNVIAS